MHYLYSLLKNILTELLGAGFKVYPVVSGNINDMIKNSVFDSEESLVKYLLNNVHSGTTALLKLKFWSKV